MGKTLATQIIEYQVFDYLYLKKGFRVALEVDLPHRMCPKDKQNTHRVDIAGIKNDVVICVEIKISVADFKSEHGHNLYGHKNYYALPKTLIERVEHLIPSHVGIISCDLEGHTYESRDGNKYTFRSAPVVYKKAKTQIIEGFDDARWSDKKSMKDDMIATLDTARTSTIRRFLAKAVDAQPYGKQIEEETI